MKNGKLQKSDIFQHFKIHTNIKRLNENFLSIIRSDEA